MESDELKGKLRAKSGGGMMVIEYSAQYDPHDSITGKDYTYQ